MRAEGGPRDRRVVEAVDDAVAQRADLRVVAVQDEHRLRWELVDGEAPALGDQLELAVSVELVPEEISQADGARPHAPEHLWERGLVHLEEPELGVPRREERRRHARDEVRAGVVVREPEAWAEDLGRHRRGRRLAVRRRDDRGPGRQAGRQAVDRARVELREELARDGHAGTRADEARQRGDTPRGPNLDGQTHRPRVRDERGYLVRVNRRHRAGPDPYGGGFTPGSGLPSPCFTCFFCGPCASAHGH